MNDDIETGAYKLWSKRVLGDITDNEALELLLQLLAGIIRPEDIDNDE